VQALLAANAGDTTSKAPSVPSIQVGNYDQIPADMLFLGVVGADDDVVGQDIVVSLYNDLPQIPSANREVLELTSDDHGSPSLEANHRAPLSSDPAFDSGGPIALLPANLGFLVDGRSLDGDSIDAFDFYGYWKWLDALTDAAFYRTNRPYALGSTPEQTFMGNWSDGEPVNPAVRILPASP
jgi:hypothetical protein